MRLRTYSFKEKKNKGGWCASGDKAFRCTPFGSARVPKLLTFALSIHVALTYSVFPIQILDVCSIDEANKK